MIKIIPEPHLEIS